MSASQGMKQEDRTRKLEENVERILSTLERMSEALAHLAPTSSCTHASGSDGFSGLRVRVSALADSEDRYFVWDASRFALRVVRSVEHRPLSLFRGVEAQADRLFSNTMRFAGGLPANHALLWGSRGMGKSSLVKSVVEAVRQSAVREAFASGCSSEDSSPTSLSGKEKPDSGLALIEVCYSDLESLAYLVEALREQSRRAILFCDDIGFASGHEYASKSLKTVLEGGLDSGTSRILFYATSNRRHLLPSPARNGALRSELHSGDAVEEQISLSDRFGLWIGFHACSEQTFRAMVDAYAMYYRLPRAGLQEAARVWAATRGARSGRVAWQFVQDWASRHARRLASPEVPEMPRKPA